jgi:hypothetical protein
VIPVPPRKCRLSLPPRSSLSGETSSSFDQFGILRDPSVRDLKREIRLPKVFCLQHRKSSAPKQLRAVRPAAGRQAIKPLHEVVVELNQHLSSCHNRMLTHMVSTEHCSRLPIRWTMA